MADTTHAEPARILNKAFSLTSSDGRLTTTVDPDFSNAPESLPPEKGFPYGGLLAALCVQAMRQGLGITAPLQTLTVQYLAAARYGEELEFRPRMLRDGRQVTFATLEAGQGDRLTHHASGTFGINIEDTPALYDRRQTPPALDGQSQGYGMPGNMAPRFASQVEYCFVDGPNIMGGNADRTRVERCWMRMRDGLPLDELRLCYLLDALYPPSWTGFHRPPMMTSIDLRYDFLTPPTPQNAPEGWAFFEFSLIQHEGSWALDDALAWGADGTVLAAARQHRKVIGS